MRKLVAWTALAMLATGVSGTASAGEITGGPRPKATPAGDRAQSECAFSGQEDGVTLIGFDENDNPVLVFDTPTGPGIVQTPHHENGAGIVHEPGVAGFACRGN